jgi:hypothetical protein
MLVEVNMPRGDDTVRHRIITSVAFSVSRVTKKDARQGARSKFMRGGGDDTRITEATKNSETIIGGRGTEEKMMRCITPTDTTRAKVNKKCGGGKGIRPKPGWHVGVEQKSADTIVKSAKNSFCPAILLGGVWTC